MGEKRRGPPQTSSPCLRAGQNENQLRPLERSFGSPSDLVLLSHGGQEVPTTTQPSALDSPVFLHGSGLNKSKRDYYWYILFPLAYSALSLISLLPLTVLTSLGTLLNMVDNRWERSTSLLGL